MSNREIAIQMLNNMPEYKVGYVLAYMQGLNADDAADDMTCFYCKGNMKESVTTHVVDLKECLIIIRNVPCLECEQCGETVYTDDVARKLDEIVKACKAVASEITIVNYTDRVA